LIFSGLTLSTLAQNEEAYVPTPRVGASMDQPTSFSCESRGVSIGNCLWERLPEEGETKSQNLVYFNPTNARPGQSVAPGYSYIGTGLEKGQCGLSIASVKDKDNGQWQCTLFTTTGVLRGRVELGILRKKKYMFGMEGFL